MLNKEIAARSGFIISISLTIMTTITFITALLTPPVSGLFCKESCIVYPFTDIIERYPKDYLWMYPTIVLTILFLLLMICIHYASTDEKRIYSLTGLSFSLISSNALIINYFLQISVIQPSLVNGETDGISILS
jgi:hypothetical protein